MKSGFVYDQNDRIVGTVRSASAPGQRSEYILVEDGVVVDSVKFIDEPYPADKARQYFAGKPGIIYTRIGSY